ncbi:MAG TPA: response regulator [Noviherbaspirillum sp.]|jgi:CheY-like chemotaxis protein|uniref:response regulator transcription factor n=1 Tax=Noviherbaspirillum sp. TaxID=1926288 RepID=UPI002DDCAF0C|nr:response regulator [Noviherbaspirillum sp.]HEV2610361.1 response regulator [Noviherbaspirillum sp.]
MYAHTILRLTAEGKAAMKQAGPDIPADALRLLKMIDGRSSIAHLTARVGDRITGDFMSVAGDLHRRGWIESVDDVPSADAQRRASGLDDDEAPMWSEARRAARLLHEKGFYTHVSRETPGEPLAASGLKVLVVEDDQDMVQLMTTLLGERGFAVTQAADTPDVLQLFKDGYRPDIVLLDVVLPSRDGFYVLKHIRRYTDLSDVPVIMVTSRVADEDLQRGLKEGADGYIFKPFRWETLYACMRDVGGG